MIEIEAEAWKKLLEAKHVVHFVGSHPEYWQERVAGKYFRIQRTQQIPYDRAYILDPDTQHDLDVDDDTLDDATNTYDLGLYPDVDSTLYEILVGIESTSGSALVYPRYPANEWFETLEEGGYVPTPEYGTPSVPTHNRARALRYLSPFTEETSPPNKPQVRLHTIKKEEGIGLRIYNDAPIDNKIVLNFIVNRCLMDEVSEADLTQKELERARELEHPGIVARGKWAETAP